MEKMKELHLAQEVAAVAAQEISGLEKQIELSTEGQLRLLEDIITRLIEKEKILKRRIVWAVSGFGLLQLATIALFLAR